MRVWGRDQWERFVLMKSNDTELKENFCISWTAFVKLFSDRLLRVTKSSLCNVVNQWWVQMLSLLCDILDFFSCIPSHPFLNTVTLPYSTWRASDQVNYCLSKKPWCRSDSSWISFFNHSLYEKEYKLLLIYLVGIVIYMLFKLKFCIRLVD